MDRAGHLRHLAVFAFWLGSLGTLAYRELWFPWASRKPVLGDLSLSAAPPGGRESWKGIYADRTKIGYFHEIRSPAPEPAGGTLLWQEGRVILSMLGERRDLFMSSETVLDAAGQIVRTQSLLRFFPTQISVEGLRRGDRLELTVQQGGARWRMPVPLQESPVSLEHLPALVAAGKLQPGQRFNLTAVDPFSFQPARVEVEVRGRRLYLQGDRATPATLLEVRTQGLAMTRWIADDGTVLQEESPWGWTLRSEDPEKAREIPMAQWRNAPDLLAMVAVPSEVWIDQPRQVRWLEAELRHPDWEEPRSVIVQAAGPPETPARRPVTGPGFEPDLAATPFIQVGDPAIARAARSVVGEETDAWRAAVRVNDWVYRSVRKVPTLGLPVSTQVLRRMEGDCNEHPCLYVALARASGIPCRIVMGLVYFDGAFVYHTWPKVFVGRWVEVDPTLGQAPADATHIPLVEAGLEESVRMAPFVGRLQIKVKRHD